MKGQFGGKPKIEQYFRVFDLVGENVLEVVIGEPFEVFGMLIEIGY